MEVERTSGQKSIRIQAIVANSSLFDNVYIGGKYEELYRNQALPDD